MPDKSPKQKPAFKADIDYELLAAEIAKALPPVVIHIHVSNPPAVEDWNKITEDNIESALERLRGRHNVDPMTRDESAATIARALIKYCKANISSLTTKEFDALAEGIIPAIQRAAGRGVNIDL